MTTGAPRGAVATPHADATLAGENALRSGGNAVDAALAAAALLTVVYPNQCSIGGDVIALVGTVDGTVTVVNGSGRSAAALDPTDYAARAEWMPVTGARSVTVPGALDAWRVLAERWGTTGLREPLRNAAAAAAAGVPVAPGVHRDLVREQQALARDPGAREVFFRDGRVLDSGALLRLPRLAGTLSTIAESGTDSFYRGEIARSLAGTLESLGGDLRYEDFAQHGSTVQDAVSVEFAGEEYVSAAGNSQGTFFLRGLAALEHIVRATGSVLDPVGDGAAVVARVLARAADERDQLLADPEAQVVPPAELLAEQSTRALAEAAWSGVGTTVLGGRSRATAGGDTVAVVTADAAGNWVSLIQSAFHAFGACVVDPHTGVLLHNRAACFSLDPESPNRLAPGKRPAHTLMPVLVRRSGAVVGAHGTMGGRAQPQIHTHLALNLARGHDLSSSVARPRWVIGSLEAGASGAEAAITVSVERDVAVATGERLRAAGFRTRELPERDDEVGHLQVVRRNEVPDGFAVASDPRSDGCRT